jgi:SAM-dependent methyltransferase
MITLADKASFWNEKYLNNESNWDLKSASPAFIEMISQKKFFSNGRLLISGCGKGYDAVAAAKEGFDVTAVDFSEYAINFARELADRNSVSINFIEEDIFKLDESFKSQFDLVYDYVMYCAINPLRRKEYAEKISSFLKVGGKLLAFLFPVEKREGGPPYGISISEVNNNFSRFLALEYSTKNINSIKPRLGREVIHIYKKLD